MPMEFDWYFLVARMSERGTTHLPHGSPEGINDNWMDVYETKPRHVPQECTSENDANVMVESIQPSQTAVSTESYQMDISKLKPDERNISDATSSSDHRMSSDEWLADFKKILLSEDGAPVDTKLDCEEGELCDDNNDSKPASINSSTASYSHTVQDPAKPQADSSCTADAGSILPESKTENPCSQIVCQPNENDVLFGRGGKGNNHNGNKRYREMVQELKPEYMKRTKIEKTELSQDVVDSVRKAGGRFLVQDQESQNWYEADNRKARKKVSQAFRENERERTPKGKKRRCKK